jgi:hypothetical protein
VVAEAEGAEADEELEEVCAKAEALRPRHVAAARARMFLVMVAFPWN